MTAPLLRFVYQILCHCLLVVPRNNINNNYISFRRTKKQYLQQVCPTSSSTSFGIKYCNIEIDRAARHRVRVTENDLSENSFVCDAVCLGEVLLRCVNPQAQVISEKVGSGSWLSAACMRVNADSVRVWVWMMALPPCARPERNHPSNHAVPG